MKGFAKRSFSFVLVFSMILGLASCKSKKKDNGLSSCTNVEKQLDSLKNVEGNIWVNEDKKYETLVNLMLYEVQETDFRGSMIVATDDEVIFASGSRLLDIDGNEVTPNTTYELGSISKSFAALCILKLQEEGKLSLDDELGKYFPEYSSCANFENTSKVTISQLLHMRSGIPDDMNEPDLFWGIEKKDSWLNPTLSVDPQKQGEVLNGFYANVDDDTFLNQAFTTELIYEPGSKASYSNSNYWILAIIVEKVSGKAYNDYVNEVILNPCNMTSSSSLASDDVTASMKPGAWTFRPETIKGSGDIHGSAVDLLKYDRALFGGYLLNQESMDILLDPIDKYGCGWEIFDNKIAHGGATPGFHTYHIIFEKDGQHLYAIMLANAGENRLDNFLIEQIEKTYKGMTESAEEKAA